MEPSLRHMIFEEILACLDLPTMEERREKNLIPAYKTNEGNGRSEITHLYGMLEIQGTQKEIEEDKVVRYQETAFLIVHKLTG